MKGESLPTTTFQVLLLLVSGRVKTKTISLLQQDEIEAGKPTSRRCSIIFFESKTIDEITVMRKKNSPTKQIQA